MPTTQHNTLAAVAVICVCILGGISIFSGHDGLEITLLTISALATGTPLVGSFVDQKAKTTSQVTAITTSAPMPPPAMPPIVPPV